MNFGYHLSGVIDPDMVCGDSNDYPSSLGMMYVFFSICCDFVNSKAIAEVCSKCV